MPFSAIKTSPLYAEEWTHKLMRVWKPTHLLSVRPRATGGLLFIAELAPDLILHLGVQDDGIDMCALWQGEECILWDSLIGFCATLPSPLVSWQQNSFAVQMRLLIRRNCFVLGCNVEGTDDEKSAWREWMGEQAPA